MKEYFNRFKVMYFIIGGLVVLLAVIMGYHLFLSSMTQVERNNSESKTEERVFDYADKLTPRQEDKLRKLIAKREKQTACDIVLITLDESLEAYAKKYEDQIGYLSPEQYVMVYADNFFDENALGYNAPHGNGVVYVDNWQREMDGWRYTWFSTSGNAQNTYSNDMINYLIDQVISLTNISPYLAYKTFINQFYYDMTGKVHFTYSISFVVILGVSLFVAIIYVIMHLVNNKGKKTTSLNTYVEGGTPKFRNKQDTFLHKTVTSRKIERNTGGGSGGGGGGGSHMSSGGFSHGGGGGRH